jgi:hypothetical protein
MTNLLTLAAQCGTAAASLLTGPGADKPDVRFLAQGYLKLAGALVECSFLPDPYLYHVQVTCWAGVEYWRKWLAGDDLTAAQEVEFTAIAGAWADLLAAWDAAQDASEAAA